MTTSAFTSPHRCRSTSLFVAVSMSPGAPHPHSSLEKEVAGYWRSEVGLSAYLDYCNVEVAAPKVEDHDRTVLNAIGRVCQDGGGGLVDEAQHLGTVADADVWFRKSLG